MRAATGGSIRDRTAEFNSIVERLQKQQGLASTSAPNGAGPSAARATAQQHSEFAKKASAIGLAIHRTSLKLQKLAQLAKRSSMFDDPGAEIDELTGIIKQDIQDLNTAIAELQRISSRKEEGNKQSADHSHTVVDTLRTRLRDATAEFKDVLTARSENIKVHQERRQLFTNQAKGGSMERMPLLLPRKVDGEAPSAASLFGGQQGQASSSGMRSGGMLLQQQMVQQQDQYISSRAEALQNVESTIVELGTIFTQLAEMVQAQGEMAARIDENVEEALGNVDSAKAQLMKYLNSASSNRWLVLKVFGVLLAFLMFFIVFIA